MTEEQKYYVPEIEEFRFGFEYEIFEDFDHLPKKQWHKQVYGENGTNPENMDFVSENRLKDFRVPFLSHQDIEECGWGNYAAPQGEYDHTWTKGNYELKSWFNNEVPTVRISQQRVMIFHGKIKNKNELQSVMKMLEIK